MPFGPVGVAGLAQEQELDEVEICPGEHVGIVVHWPFASVCCPDGHAQPHPPENSGFSAAREV